MPTYPLVSHTSLDHTLAWRDDPAGVAAFEAGRTGYPIVDAAMRELVATGYMHNRARMIVASFLAKDLLVDWRIGEAIFMRHLLDGDPASNNGGIASRQRSSTWNCRGSWRRLSGLSC